PADALTERVAAAAFPPDLRLRLLEAPSAARDDVDHATDRLAPVKAGRGTAKHLDALHVVERERLDVVEPGEVRWNRAAIDDDERLVAVRAAHECARDGTGRAAVGDGQSRNGAQRLGEQLELLFLDLLPVNDG